MLRRLAVLAALVLCSCSKTPASGTLVRDAVSAMGGAEKLRAVHTLTLRDGSGTRRRLGQTVRTSDAENVSQLANVTEIGDLQNNRASFDYQIRDGAFVQHRREVLTSRDGKFIGLEAVETRPIAVTSASGLFSWGSQNSPDFLLRRNIITVVLAATDAANDDAVENATFNDRPVSVIKAKTRDGENVKLFLDRASHLPAGFQVVDTETILGDVEAEYVLDDYKTIDGLTLPLHVTVKKGGKDYSDVQFKAFAVNASDAVQVFAIPPAAAAQVDQVLAEPPDYSPLALVKVADRVYLARGYSHHSLIVEFPTSLTVVEGPYTEAQSKTLLRLLGHEFPGKPIRYVVVTHHHYDHIGGVRAIAAAGATVLVAKGDEPELRMLIESPHTHPLDLLETNRRAGQKTGEIELFDDRKTIDDGNQRLELYAFNGSPHVEPMVMAFVPNANLLFQSDLWFPGAGSNGSAGPAAAKQLLDTVRKLGLRVETNAGGHGGVAPFAEFAKAVEPAKAGN